MQVLRRLLGQPCGSGLKEQDRNGNRRTSYEVPVGVKVKGVGVAPPKAVEEEVAGRGRTGDLFWRSALADGRIGWGGLWGREEREAARVTQLRA